MKVLNKRAIIVNLLGIILTRAVLYSMNPVAIAYFSAAYLDKSLRFLLLASTLGGLALWMPFIEAVPYITVILMIIVITGLIERQKKQLTPVRMGLISTIVTIGVVGGFKSSISLGTNDLIMVLIEGILVYALFNVFCLGITYFNSVKKGQAPNNEELISSAILLAIIVYAMPKVGGIYFSVEETVAYFLILFMGYKYGAGAGAICGTACGIVVGLQAGNVDVVGIFCILGICSGVFRKASRVGSGISFLTVAVSLGYLYDKSMLEVGMVRALASATAAFLILPKSILYMVDAPNVPKEEAFVKERLQEIAKGKLNEFAESFKTLSKTFYQISETKSSLSREDINFIFDSLSDHLCRHCINCDRCWKNNFYDTYKAAFSILSSAERNGEVRREDIPRGFAMSCIKLESFLYETNRGLELAKVNLAWQNRMAESREAIAGQLGEVAAIIQNFSNDLYDTAGLEDGIKERIISYLKVKNIHTSNLCVLEKRNHKQEIYITCKTKSGRCITTREMASYISEVMGKRVRVADGAKNIVSKEYDAICFVEDTIFKTLTGVARAAKDAEKVSGDNFSFLSLSNGEMIMTLSDGMGAGVQASEESQSVIELLEQFLEAGFREESAIKLINSILVLRSDQQSCTTIDMSVINLFTGVCDFIKIGAAATFIMRDNWVEVITSTSLPVGVFNQVDIDGVSKKLYNGDLIVMVSDGVLDCIQEEDKENFIVSVLTSVHSNNPQEIADIVLDKAKAENGGVAMDDMTVLVAGIWNKS